jgi:hypothetical protein
MSSWLSRVACRYDCEPEPLFTLLLSSKQEAEWSDGAAIDWGMSLPHQLCIAEATHLHSTVVASCDAAQRFPLVPVFWFSWPNCLAVAGDGEPRASQFAWAWCPDCLTESHKQTGQDFLRMEWCFAPVTLCARHQRPLLNHCLCGSRERPVHVASGKESRLCCSQCGLLLAGQGRRRSRQEPLRTFAAASVQLSFEQDLMAALSGQPVGVRWCGAAKPAELLAAVSDIADVLCAASGHRGDVPLDAFDTCSHYRPRLHLPNVHHKLCGLSADWRRQVIAAVLAVIGDANVCAVMASDQRLEERPILEEFRQWSGSLEWLIHFIRPAYRHGLYRRATHWPPRLRARYRAGVTGLY